MDSKFPQIQFVIKEENPELVEEMLVEFQKYLTPLRKEKTKYDLHIRSGSEFVRLEVIPGDLDYVLETLMEQVKLFWENHNKVITDFIKNNVWQIFENVFRLLKKLKVPSPLKKIGKKFSIRIHRKDDKSSFKKFQKDIQKLDDKQKKQLIKELEKAVKSSESNDKSNKNEKSKRDDNKNIKEILTTVRTRDRENSGLGSKLPSSVDVEGKQRTIKRTNKYVKLKRKNPKK